MPITEADISAMTLNIDRINNGLVDTHTRLHSFIIPVSAPRQSPLRHFPILLTSSTDVESLYEPTRTGFAGTIRTIVFW